MRVGDGELWIDGDTVRAGRALYDTDYGRVLWITAVDDTGVTVEPVVEYALDDSIGWPPGGHVGELAAGTAFSRSEFTELVETGRFELGPR